jgi:uncharacterized protein with ParB-like and HNH nuclease domain/protein-tyrosine phosphatase
VFDAVAPGNLNPAEPSRFHDILQKYLFRIPEYQRGYSWGVEELKDFIQDLETIINNYPSTGEHHNFGTIQCKQQGEYKSDLPGGHDAILYDVSDGQQRLITTLLFLRALGETLKERGEPKHLSGLVNNFKLTYKKKLGGGRLGHSEHIQRLSIPKHTPFNDCLSDLMLNGDHRRDDTTPVRRMKHTHNWFKEELEDKSLSECKEYKKTILERAEIVLLSNINSNPHMVFEARNNRGRPVSELDKVKNLIQLIEQRGHISSGIDFPKIWFQSLLDLDEYNLSGRTNENLIVSYSMSISVRGRFIPPKTCYSDFRDKFWPLTERPNRTLENQLKIFVQGYQDVVEAFRQLRRNEIKLPRFNPQRTQDLNKAKDALYNIRLSNKIQIMEPILIASYISIDADKLVDFARVAQTAERALFRVYIAPRSGQGPRRVDFKQNERHEAAFEIYRKVPKPRTFGGTSWCLPSKSRKRAISSLPTLLPDEYATHFLCDLTINEAGRTLSVMMQDIIGAKNAYNTGSNWGHYLLFQYEKTINPGLNDYWHDNFVVNGRDSRSFTMEHIMPQDPRQELGGSIQNYWLRDKTRGFASPEESEAYLNRLGNLVMSKAARNTWYSNHPYRSHRSEPPGSGNKRTMYRNHTSHGNDWNRVHEIGRYYNNWGKQTIVHRHAFIALWATERWKMDCTCDSKPDEEDMRILESLDELHPIFNEENGDKDWYKPESFEETIVGQEDELEDEEDLADDDETLVVTEEQESPDYEPFEDDLLEVELEIPDVMGQNVWIEKRNLEGESHRIEGERAMGSAIWSPLLSKSNIPGRRGSDIYRFMRDVSQGDLIIHLADKAKKARFTGVSIVKSPEILHDKGLPNTRWDEKTDCYMHMLEGYTELEEPLRIYEHILTKHNKSKLDEIRADQEASFYNKKNNLREGAYLTPCSPALAELINQICKHVNNSPLPHFGEQQTSDITSTETKTASLEQKSVKDAESYYGGNANLGPAWPDDTIVFGSERPGYSDGGKVKQGRVVSWTNVMKAHGIKRVVCLLHPEGKLGLYDDLEAQYKSHFSSENVLMTPIIDRDISSKDQIKNIVDFLDESERLELPVVVHCSMGSGRTGHVLAVWRNFQWGVDRDEALKSTKWGLADRDPLEANGRKSSHLGRLIDRTDYYDLMNAVRKDEEE